MATQRIVRMANAPSSFREEVAIPKSFMLNYLTFVLLLVVIAVFLFFLVRTRIESYQLGYQIEKLKREKMNLQEDLCEYRAQYTKLKSRAYLLKWNEEKKLDLKPPQEWLEIK